MPLDMSNFTPEASVAVTGYAPTHAGKFAQRKTGPEMILLGVMSRKSGSMQEGPIEKMMHLHFDVTLNDVHKAVGRIYTSNGANRGHVSGFSSKSEQALRIATKVAQRAHPDNKSVTRSDVVVGLVESNDPIFLRLLNDLKIQPERLKEVMESTAA